MCGSRGIKGAALTASPGQADRLGPARRRPGQVYNQGGRLPEVTAAFFGCLVQIWTSGRSRKLLATTSRHANGKLHGRWAPGVGLCSESSRLARTAHNRRLGRRQLNAQSANRWRPTLGCRLAGQGGIGLAVRSTRWTACPPVRLQAMDRCGSRWTACLCCPSVGLRGRRERQAAHPVGQSPVLGVRWKCRTACPCGQRVG